MPARESDLPVRLLSRLDQWLACWGTPSLARTLRVEWSPRLTRAFGRCYLDQRLIRLTPSLRDTQSWLLPEILCHEAAHAAVYELYGDDAAPHGSEWQELMELAGFRPRVRIPVVVRRATSASPLFLHRCPVCDRSRSARRPMPQWRCRACVTTGRGGRLVIRRDSATRPRRREAAAIGLPDPGLCKRLRKTTSKQRR